MGVTAVYFSPTGNTKKSVEAMRRRWIQAIRQWI